MLTLQSVEIPSRAQLTALGADPNDFGITNPPANFRVPQFNIRCVPILNTCYSATVQITQRAYEGDNSAYHLGAGTHSTDLMFSNGGLTNYVAGDGNRRIYVEVSGSIATDSRHAEEEHCRDIRHAYDITLSAVQDALDRAALRAYEGQTSDLAMQAAKHAISQGLHIRLRTLLIESNLGAGGINMPLFSAKLGALYLEICNKSQDRDARGWHFFSPDSTGESWSMRSWAEYASATCLPSSVHQYWAGDVKDIRALVRGRQFSVNTTPSAQIVML